jgi:hypothetical protein
LSAQQQFSALQIKDWQFQAWANAIFANLTIRSNLRNIHILPRKRSSSRVRQGMLQCTRVLSFALRQLVVEGLADTALAVRTERSAFSFTDASRCQVGILYGCWENVPEDLGCSIAVDHRIALGVGHIAVVGSLAVVGILAVGSCIGLVSA